MGRNKYVGLFDEGPEGRTDDPVTGPGVPPYSPTGVNHRRTTGLVTLTPETG